MALKPKKKKTLTKEEEDALKAKEAEEAAVKLAAKKKRALQKESIKNPKTKVSSKKVPEAVEGATDTAEEATDTTGLSNKPEYVKARAHYKKTRDEWEVELKKKESKVKKKRLERAYGTKEQNKIMEWANNNPFTEGYNLAEGRGKFKPEFESQFKKSASKKAKTLEKLDQVDAAKTEIKKTLPQSLNPDKMRHGKRKARYGARLQARATTKAGVGRSIPEHIRGWRESLKKKKKK